MVQTQNLCLPLLLAGWMWRSNSLLWQLDVCAKRLGFLSCQLLKWWLTNSSAFFVCFSLRWWQKPWEYPGNFWLLEAATGKLRFVQNWRASCSSGCDFNKMVLGTYNIIYAVLQNGFCDIYLALPRDEVTLSRVCTRIHVYFSCRWTEAGHCLSYAWQLPRLIRDCITALGKGLSVLGGWRFAEVQPWCCVQVSTAGLTSVFTACCTELPESGFFLRSIGFVDDNVVQLNVTSGIQVQCQIC